MPQPMLGQCRRRGQLGVALEIEKQPAGTVYTWRHEHTPPHLHQRGDEARRNRSKKAVKNGPAAGIAITITSADRSKKAAMMMKMKKMRNKEAAAAVVLTLF